MSSAKVSTKKLERRYANALFDVAVGKKTVDKVAKDLEALKETLASSEDLQKLIVNPTVQREVLGSLFEGLLKKIKADKLTISFMHLMADRRRLAILDGMISQFLKKYAKHQGLVEVTVTTAIPLDKKRQTQLKKQLESNIGKSVKIEMAVNPDILGGMIIKVGSQMLDDSIVSKLNRIKLMSKGAIASLSFNKECAA